MAQSDEPITSEVVATEVLGALEEMAEDGGSELGIFRVRQSSKNTSRLVLRVGDQRFYLTVKEIT